MSSDNAPSREQILEGIAEVARRQIGLGDRLTEDMRLIEDLSLDSIKLLTLAVEVENHFQVCLDPELDRELRSIADLIEAIQKQLEDGA